MPALIDSHCHLDDAAFDTDRGVVLSHAAEAGIDSIVVPAISARYWPRLRAVVATDARLFAAYGLHPMYLPEHRPEHLTALREWITRERPVAVGECGLDFYVGKLDVDAQIDFFTAQLRLAREFDLPVIVHARRAVDEVIKYLRRFPGLRGVVHSFAGSLQQAERLFANGFLLGLGGPLTYPRAQRLRRVAAALPLEAILLESDAPDQPGIAHRGQRNEPAFIGEVRDTLADLRQVSPTLIAQASTRNARALFGPPLMGVDESVTD
ncbi:TatD family hydrolase [Acidihalobacter ferrooxydans]|uniref:DNAase n=1 Tax=Acidihalobacter ferrooxydans TaxID=1765967 RepID=A0A1P8UK94_9GAMM|nr:TatD family hydrolase [Acidihalobacter ferrooxydans]APZ44258.1 DNAase [Acidihalobacter ferrooxydans]